MKRSTIPPLTLVTALLAGGDGWERGGGAVSFTTGSEWTDQEFSPGAVLPPA